MNELIEIKLSYWECVDNAISLPNRAFNERFYKFWNDLYQTYTIIDLFDNDKNKSISNKRINYFIKENK